MCLYICNVSKWYGDDGDHGLAATQDWSGIPLTTASDPTSYQPNVAGRVLL